MSVIESYTEDREMVNERLIDYILVQSLLNFDEYSRVLKRINVEYKDIREKYLNKEI